MSSRNRNSSYVPGMGAASSYVYRDQRGPGVYDNRPPISPARQGMYEGLASRGRGPYGHVTRDRHHEPIHGRPPPDRRHVRRTDSYDRSTYGRRYQDRDDPRSSDDRLSDILEIRPRRSLLSGSDRLGSLRSPDVFGRPLSSGYYGDREFDGSLNRSGLGSGSLFGGSRSQYNSDLPSSTGYYADREYGGSLLNASSRSAGSRHSQSTQLGEVGTHGPERLYTSNERRAMLAGMGLEGIRAAGMGRGSDRSSQRSSVRRLERQQFGRQFFFPDDAESVDTLPRYYE